MTVPDTGAAIVKMPTGVAGLDEILHGGLPKGALTVISGGPGAGKTLLGLETLYRAGRNGEPGVVVSFEERTDHLKRNVRVLGWDLAALEAAGSMALIEARIDPAAVIAGAFDLAGILAILEQRVHKLGASRILLDAPDVFLRLLDDPVRERRELQRIHDWLRQHALTALMTVKHRGCETLRYDFLDYMADCVITLDQRVDQQVATRRLRVIKYRGSDFGRNEYPFAIFRDGLHIIPVTATSLRHRALGEQIPSGVAALDDILGGGFRRSSCNLYSGTSGTGKTTLACAFVHATCARGERVLYIDFEESEEALFSGMLSSGLDLRPDRDGGLLHFLSVMPEALGVEEHLIRAFTMIRDLEPGAVVVDAISACRRMGSAQAAFDYLLRLIDFCKARGVTSVLTNLATNQQHDHEVTGVDLSSVIDTVILLRNSECDRVMQRSLLVLKSRGRAHSDRRHRFRITDDGIIFDREPAEDRQ